ncbi:GNAT family N-acetyltransferase [Paenibacillus sp. FSL W8-0426]|uniref:GNAT family N-acetyltransferase n=1 Tax=Paenibacillus sp. FSL W8-0426 TaxID=2921714 RepID=UPI0030D97179
MITELNPHEFGKVRHLVDSSGGAEVRAVADCINPGRIYVNEELNGALFWIEGQGGFQLIGDFWRGTLLVELETFMRETIEPEMRRLGKDCIEIAMANERGEKAFRQAMVHRETFSDVQYVFGFLGKREQRAVALAHPMPNVSNGPDETVSVVRISRELLEDESYGNREFLAGKILQFWHSGEAFFQHGLGYAVVQHHQIASVCFSAFVAGRIHAIDIETMELYRYKRYASLAAKVYINECIRREIEPYWDCSPDNEGSIRLAKGLGMSLNFDYRICWYSISK